MTMEVNMRNIDRLVRGNNTKHETAGYMNASMRLFQTSVSKTNPKNGRKYVEFPEKGSIKWHTHPTTDGFWPSFEDLVQGYNDKRTINVLFTKYGTWVFLGFGRVPDQFHHDLLYQNWNWLHVVLEIRTSHQQWTDTEIMQYINHFTHILNKIGYHIEFVPNFKSMDIDKYTQLVQHRIARLSKHS